MAVRLRAETLSHPGMAAPLDSAFVKAAALAAGFHKVGIARAAPLDPAALLCGWLRLLHSMRLTLAVAGCPADGLAGLVAIKGLAGLYLSVLPVFLADRSGDHAATMAALDKRLRCIQSLADWVRGRMPKTA